MKTKEELKNLKEEIETLNRKLAELTEVDLAQVAGGANSAPCGCASCNYGSKEECTFYRSVGGNTKCKYD